MGSLQAGGWESTPEQGEESLLQLLCFSDPQVDMMTLFFMVTLMMIRKTMVDVDIIQHSDFCLTFVPGR